jgi:hypothetical protein
VQIRALGGELHHDGGVSDVTQDESHPSSEIKSGDMDGPLALWRHGAIDDSGMTADTAAQCSLPRSKPWTESWLDRGRPTSSSGSVAPAVILKRRRGRFCMTLGETPIVIERTSDVGTLRRMRIEGAGVQVGGSGLSVEDLRSPSALRHLKRAPSGVLLSRQHSSSDSSGFVESRSGGLNSPQQRQPQSSRTLRRNVSLPRDYFRSHSRPPNGEGGCDTDEVVVGLLPLPQLAPASASDVRSIASSPANSAPTPSGGSSDIVRVRWHVDYTFSYDPLLDGPDVQLHPSLVAPDRHANAASSSRDVLLAYASLMQQDGIVHSEESEDHSSSEDSKSEIEITSSAATAQSSPVHVGGDSSLESFHLASNVPEPDSEVAINAYFEAVAMSRSEGLDQLLKMAERFQRKHRSSAVRGAAGNSDPSSSVALGIPNKRSTKLEGHGLGHVAFPPLLRHLQIDESNDTAGGVVHVGRRDLLLSPSLGASVAVEGRLYQHILNVTPSSDSTAGRFNPGRGGAVKRYVHGKAVMAGIPTTSPLFTATQHSSTMTATTGAQTFMAADSAAAATLTVNSRRAVIARAISLSNRLLRTEPIESVIDATLHVPPPVQSSLSGPRILNQLIKKAAVISPAIRPPDVQNRPLSRPAIQPLRGVGEISEWDISSPPRKKSFNHPRTFSFPTRTDSQSSEIDALTLHYSHSSISMHAAPELPAVVSYGGGLGLSSKTSIVGDILSPAVHVQLQRYALQFEGASPLPARPSASPLAPELKKGVKPHSLSVALLESLEKKSGPGSGSSSMDTKGGNLDGPHSSSLSLSDVRADIGRSDSIGAGNHPSGSDVLPARRRKSKAPHHARRLLDAVVGRF